MYHSLRKGSKIAFYLRTTYYVTDGCIYTALFHINGTYICNIHKIEIYGVIYSYIACSQSLHFLVEKGLVVVHMVTKDC